MVHVRIASLAMDPVSAQPVIVLKPVSEAQGHGRILPIWIGHPEATAILLALEGSQPPRPLTHDLMKDLLDALGAVVERVEIIRVDSGTFFAIVVVRDGDSTVAVDARPSDSIALAIRMGAPIFVDDEVLDTASVPDEMGPAEDEETQLAAFREFLDAVDPEDFQS